MKKQWVGASDADLAHENISSMTLSLPQIADKKMNDDAWSYLVMAYDREPFNYAGIVRCTVGFDSGVLV
jgi:hypothetical protein